MIFEANDREPKLKQVGKVNDQVALRVHNVIFLELALQKNVHLGIIVFRLTAAFGKYSLMMKTTYAKVANSKRGCWTQWRGL